MRPPAETRAPSCSAESPVTGHAGAYGMESNLVTISKRTLITLEEAGDQLAVSAKTVRRLIAAGHLRGTFVGRKVCVRPKDLDAYLDAATAPQSLRPAR